MYKDLQKLSPLQRSFLRTIGIPCSRFAFVSSPVAQAQSRLHHRSGICVYDSRFHQIAHRMPHGRIARPIDRNVTDACVKKLNEELTCAFFFPMMIGALRCIWIMTSNSCSHGWKNRCLTLLKSISMNHMKRQARHHRATSGISIPIF